MKIGAYAVERDYSHYVAYAAKTIFAVVGTATKGPVGVATVCTSAQDLVNKFGPLKPDCYGLYAGQYFLSQSSKLYFVRAASDTAAKATVNIKGINASDVEVADALTLEALELVVAFLLPYTFPPFYEFSREFIILISVSFCASAVAILLTQLLALNKTRLSSIFASCCLCTSK